MATALIKNGAIAGALAALTQGRAYQNSVATVAPATTIAAAALAFGAQFLTANAALAVPMADADNADIFLVTFAASFGELSGRAYVSATATDYLVAAQAAAANAKANVVNLT